MSKFEFEQFLNLEIENQFEVPTPLGEDIDWTFKKGKGERRKTKPLMNRRGREKLKKGKK